MLENYKVGQPIAYNIMKNAIINNKISHAYIIDSNGNKDVMNIVLSFVKEIIISDLNTNDELNNITNVCHRIDDGNYLDVKVIEPDGMWIKKNQLLDLQSEFNKKAIEGNRKIYIIKSADKMNVQTANSILKFLEEPIDDIVAFLIVNNINLLLPTIISRCQVIKLCNSNFSLSSVETFSNVIDLENSISLENRKLYVDTIINFINMIENSGIDTLIYTKKKWHNIFKNRESNLFAIEFMIYFYYDILRVKSGSESAFFNDNIEMIKKIGDYNSFDNIFNKLKLLDACMGNVKNNLNINLLIDKLIIDMCGDYNENSWSKN